MVSEKPVSLRLPTIAFSGAGSMVQHQLCDDVVHGNVGPGGAGGLGLLLVHSLKSNRTSLTGPE